MVNLNSFLILSAVMFAIGLFGALSKRNAVAILMSIEIMLNAVNITLVAYASALMGHPNGIRLTGQIFAIFIITVAATMVAFASSFIGKSDAAGVAVGSRLTGQIFAIFIITVAAAEAAVALAIIIGIYRRISTVDVGHINLMKW